MANISFSVNDYPHFGRLVPGQEITMKVKARVGMKILGGQDERISFLTDMIEVEPERKMSIQEVLLANIAHNTEAINSPTP